MGFRNGVVSGLTLVREAIQSLNYLAGSAGWAIKRDGNAEFSNATVRGTLVAGSGPNIVIGADIPTVVGSYYSAKNVTVTAVNIWYYNDTEFHYYLIGLVGAPTNSSIVARGEYTVADGIKEIDRYFPVSGASEAWWLIGSQTPVRVRYGGLDALGSPIPTEIDYLRGTTVTFEQGLGGNQTGIADLKFGTISSPRGYAGYLQSTVDSPAIGATETELLRLPFMQFRAGRAYAIEIGAEVKTSVANTRALFRVRIDTAGGSSITGQQVGGIFSRTITHTDNVGESFSRTNRVRNLSTADKEYDLVVTVLASSVGSTITALGGTSKGFYVAVNDIGAAAQYPSLALP